MKTRAHLFVSGYVQGVSFRYWTREEARRHNIVGWARNLADGRVEAVLEGEKANVEALIDFCHQGPDGAIVKHVRVVWEEPKGEFRDFRIRF